MKKNLKKFISILLSLLMLMSVMSVGAFAEDATATEPAPEENEQHRNMYQVIADFFLEIFSFFKYIFYDVFRGEQPA